MTVDGLVPENTYDFYLAAGNPAGFGKSIKFKVRTPRIAPTLPPMPPPVKTGEFLKIFKCYDFWYYIFVYLWVTV